MVGVAGKSKGCNTCRARKIACDQTKPLCGQCTRSNRVCGGYQKNRVFVLVQPAAKKTHIFQRPHIPELTANPEFSLNQVDTSRSPPSLSDKAALSVTQANAGGVAHSMPEMGAAHAIIQRQNNRNSLVQAFLANFFPTQHFSPSSPSWITLLATLPSKVKALEVSSAAVSASAIGRKFQDTALIKESHNLYIKGLRLLQHALRDRNLVQDDGTLAACMALSLYEAMECPSGGSGAYFSHCEGILALVQARGVEAHSEAAGHILFLGVRIPGILYALESHSSSFLFEHAWMEYPWDGKLKTPFTQIVDCLAQAPEILKRVHLLFSLHQNERTEICFTLIHECWHIDEKLDVILHTMQEVTLHPLYWQVQCRMDLLSESESESLENLFPVAFHFTNLETANSLILLWAIRVMLWSGLGNLYRLLDLGSLVPDSTTTPVLSSTPGLRDSLRPLGHRGDCTTMIHHVCQSVEYILRQETLLSGPLSVTPALGIVLESLNGQPRFWKEVAWLRAAIDVARQRGLHLLEYAR